MKTAMITALVATLSVAQSAYASESKSLAYVNQIEDFRVASMSMTEIVGPAIQAVNSIPTLRTGRGNLGLIWQDGSDNTANISQTGSRNVGLIRQIGIGNTATISQIGAGHRSLVMQQGHNNVAIIRQRSR
jgi:minor curlin subunit